MFSLTCFNCAELVISWERDFYRFRESDLLANVTLVITSNFDTSVRIPGFPTQIVNNITSMTVPGPIIPSKCIYLHQ